MSLEAQDALVLGLTFFEDKLFASCCQACCSFFSGGGAWGTEGGREREGESERERERQIYIYIYIYIYLYTHLFWGVKGSDQQRETTQLEACQFSGDSSGVDLKGQSYQPAKPLEVRRSGISGRELARLNNRMQRFLLAVCHISIRQSGSQNMTGGRGGGSWKTICPP